MRAEATPAGRNQVPRRSWLGLDAVFLYLSVAVCFVPLSVETGAGFISPADGAIVGWLSVAALLTGLSGRFQNKPILPFILTFISFLSVFISQLISPLGPPGSSLVKYFIFLLIIPAAIAMTAQPPNFVRNIIRLTSAASGVLSVFAILKIALHQYVFAGDGAFSIIFFGGLVNKTWLGSILTFGIIASAYHYMIDRQYAAIFLAIIQYAVVVIVGDRAATIVAMLSFMAVYFYLGPGAKKSIGGKSLVFILFAIMFAIAASFGILDHQFARISEIGQVSASSKSTASARILLWDFARYKIYQHPIFGWGYGTFFYDERNWLYGMYEPHNNVLQILYAGGVIGLLLFSALIGMAIKSVKRNKIDSFLPVCMIAYLMNTSVDIIWTRGDGHIFWMFAFFQILLSAKDRRKVLSEMAGASRREGEPLKCRYGRSRSDYPSGRLLTEES